MGKIFIKGIFEPIELSNESVGFINQLMATGRQNEVVQTERGAIRISQIKVALKDEERVDDEKAEKRRGELRDWYCKRREFTQLPIEEKAKSSLEQFKLYWRCFKDFEPSVEILENARKEAESFYAANTERKIVDLAIWKKIARASFNSISPLGFGGLTILNRAISADISAVKSDREFAINR